ncbi:HNH endonuclease [Oceanirhabdus seepicola]|uniref:HNH endonuclease n=1 Tax=Oceanirhabdus seepicola TaxID=2828781 RepID=A0A9J6NXQ0_9CLOT|nr:HNH endonuclease signature motif containing protein [Oceanirhabdus seepicola]MCM1988836.1 HNH endonuclease [Oceanirhabdus seepicola]
MEGWKLKSGMYSRCDLCDDDIWKIFNYILSNKTTNATSYKFGFLKALLESSYDVNLNGEIKISDIFIRFSRIYWNLIVKHELTQCTKMIKGGRSSIGKIFDKYIDDYPEISTANYDKIPINIKDKMEKEVFKEGKKYVVGALYGDSGGELYTFSLRENYLKFNPSVLSFLYKHSITLLKINNLCWIDFLEKVNKKDNCYGIAEKLHDASKRSSLRIYKDFFFFQFNRCETSCFYCGNKLSYEKVHIDHFIPWSFIKNDRLWNLVASCPNCNLSKNNRLADEYYLDKIIYRDNNLKKIDNYLVNKDFSLYSEKNFRNYYTSAEFCGFDLWNFVKAKGIEIEVDLIKK